MCGIFGYIGHRNASSLLVKGLLRLEYRGYDSSGVVVKNGQLQSYKDIGKISEMATSLPDIKGSMGIAHTRWATHGGVTKETPILISAMMGRLQSYTMVFYRIPMLFVSVSSGRAFNSTQKPILKCFVTTLRWL